MLVHSVFFWLDSALPAAVTEDFQRWLVKLTALPSVSSGYVGVPSATDRPVIDRSYSFALTVLFESMAHHDRYQVDPDHRAFVDRHRTHWVKIVIYDAESSAP